MKQNFKKSFILLVALFMGGKLSAQTVDSAMISRYVEPFSPGSGFRTWSIGLHGGVLTPYTIFGGKSDFYSPHEQIGFGGYINKQILPSFGLGLDFFMGKLGGGVATPEGPASPLSKFSTDIKWSGALVGNFTLANINWRHNKGVIQPYITLGGGVIAYTPTITDYSGVSTVVKPTNGKTYFQNMFIPVGTGLKINLSKGVNLDLGYQVNFVDADNIDGFAAGTTNDRFSYGHIGLEFALGKRSKPQMAAHNPVSSMRTEYLYQAQIAQLAIESLKGVNSKLQADLATTNQNLVKTNETIAKITADSDHDGVPDLFDKCPNTPAGVKVDGSGCPLPKAEDVKVYITEEDKKVVKDAITNLEFDSGKATIRAHSLPSLDKVAELLISKNFSIKLAGHTDATGSAASNMRLSKDRAEAIKKYLVSKGANPSRIEATGYGQTQPIASNATPEGRQQNRRVEFTLY